MAAQHGKPNKNGKIILLVIILVVLFFAAFSIVSFFRKRLSSSQIPEAQVLSVSSLSTIAGKFADAGIGAERLAIEKMQPIARKYGEERTAFQIADFPCVKQLPELPTGCEITSLTTVLNYYGFDVDKGSMADIYLNKIPIGSDYPTVGFWGDPRDSGSLGCYAPVISAATSNFLADRNASFAAANLTGTELTHLFTFIDRSQPVIVWTTIDLEEPRVVGSYTMPDGESFTWLAPFHCVVIYGYDLDEGVLFVADPLRGNVTYPLRKFRARYEALGAQAVLVYPDR